MSAVIAIVAALGVALGIFLGLKVRGLRRTGETETDRDEARTLEEVQRASEHARDQALADLAVIHADPDPVSRDDRRRAWIRAQMASARLRGGLADE